LRYRRNAPLAQALLLALPTLTGWIQPEHIILFCVIAGTVFAKRLPRLREAAKPILAARGIILEAK
jgi:hypothetical protein